MEMLDKERNVGVCFVHHLQNMFLREKSTYMNGIPYINIGEKSINQYWGEIYQSRFSLFIDFPHSFIENPNLFFGLGQEVVNFKLLGLPGTIRTTRLTTIPPFTGISLFINSLP